MKNIILFIAVFYLTACTNSKKTSKEEQVIKLDTLKPTQVISKIADSIFFRKIKLFKYKESLIISDEANTRILVTNINFKPIYTIHQKGDAPYELKYPLNILVRNDTLFVEDANFKINVYDFKNGTYLNSLKIEAKSVFGSSWISDKVGNFYLSSEPDELGKSILQLNSKGKTLRWLGEKFPKEENNYASHYKHIQITEKQNIIALSRTWAYIDFYDVSAEKLLKRIDISGYEPIQRALDSMQRDISISPEMRQNVRNLFMGAFYCNRKLYATFTDRIGVSRKHTRHLLIFDIDENNYDAKLSQIVKINSNTEDDDIHFEILFFDAASKTLYLQGNVTYNIYTFSMK
jgi:hypothetical protein